MMSRGRFSLLLLVPFMILQFFFSACTSVRYVPQEVVKRDSFYLKLIRFDSIYYHDSIYVKEKGDTVFKYKYEYVYKDRAVHDTLYMERVDSIAVPFPVERELTKWEKVKLDVGGYCIIAAIIVLILVFKKFIYRIR